MSLLDGLEEISNALWYIPLVLIVCLGIYSTLMLKGIQFRELREMIRVTFSREKRGAKSLSSFQTFCVSMGNRIGVGNITGPVMAILIGGPGAIFWMWIFACIGMATSFVETTIGQIYKERKSDGHYHGGPAYTIRNGLGMRRFASIVAFLMILMYIIGFASMEVCSMSEALRGAFVFDNNALVFASVITLVTAVVILGGMKNVARVSTVVVPIMALIWFVICVISIALSDGGVSNAFGMIFSHVFSVPSAVGGTIGGMLIIGMKRGVLSNEAGVGTITNISSMADVEHPVKQGLTQSLGVLIDTVVSTLTALVILSFGDISSIVNLNNESVPLLQDVLGSTIGFIAPYLVAIMLTTFAMTSLFGDFVIGENNLVFAKDNTASRLALRALLLIVVFISSFYASDGLFVVVDILLGVCAVTNALIVFKLGSKVAEAYKDYRKQRCEGIDTPIFKNESVSEPAGIIEWQ